MRMTNKKMFDAIQVLAQAKNETGLLGYAVAVNLRRLTMETAEYARKRDELLAEYGTAREGGKYDLTPAQASAFYAALDTYAKIETDVAVLQVEPEVFYGGKLTSGQMYALDFMVKEDDGHA